MEDPVALIPGIVLVIASFVFAYWLWIKLPADMARARHRDPVGWVLVSIFASPFLAIFVLLLVGDAE